MKNNQQAPIPFSQTSSQFPKANRLPQKGAIGIVLSALILAIIGVTVFSPNSVKAKDNSYSVSLKLQSGGAYLKVGKLKEALAAYHEALELDSLNQHALKNIGYILSNTNKSKEALPYLIRAEKVGHADADIYNLLGVAYGAVGDTTNSLASYSQAANLSSDVVDYTKNYSAALVSAGKFETALTILKKAYSMAPSDGELSYLFGNAYAGLARPKEALESYNLALKNKYDSGDLRHRMGMVSESVGDYWKAEEHYGIGLGKAPENLELRQRLAVLYSRAGVYNQAERLFKDNLSRDPNFINSRIGLGICYAFQGSTESANAELEKVRQADKGKYETMKQMIEGATKYFNDSKNKSQEKQSPQKKSDSVSTH